VEITTFCCEPSRNVRTILSIEPNHQSSLEFTVRASIIAESLLFLRVHSFTD